MDLVDLNRQARDWLDHTANLRIHGTTGEAPFARLPLEALQSTLGKLIYDTSLVTFRRSTKDSFVSYEGNYYSLSSEYARKTLKLKERETGQLLILNAQDQIIAEHHLASGRNQRIAVPAHYARIGKDEHSPKRPAAVQVAPSDNLTGMAAPEVESRPLSWYDQMAEVPA